MAFLTITANSQKVAYIRSCAGAELLTFWEKEARIRFEEIPANQAKVQGEGPSERIVTSPTRRETAEQQKKNASSAKVSAALLEQLLVQRDHQDEVRRRGGAFPPHKECRRRNRHSQTARGLSWLTWGGLQLPGPDQGRIKLVPSAQKTVMTNPCVPGAWAWIFGCVIVILKLCVMFIYSFPQYCAWVLAIFSMNNYCLFSQK